MSSILQSIMKGGSAWLFNLYGEVTSDGLKVWLERVNHVSCLGWDEMRCGSVEAFQPHQTTSQQNCDTIGT